MELRKMLRQSHPEPDCDRLRCRIVQPFDFIENVVIEPGDDRIDETLDVGEIHQPADVRVDRTAHADLATERMPVHAAALVSLRYIGQIMSGLESEILDHLNDVRLNHLDRILLAGEN